MVVFSETTRLRLSAPGRRAADEELLAATQLLWMGLMEVSDLLPPLHVYQAASTALAARLALQAPPRAKAPLLPGVPDAPLSRGVVAQLSVVGVSTLLAWDHTLTAHALQMFRDCALEQLQSRGACVRVKCV